VAKSAFTVPSVVFGGGVVVLVRAARGEYAATMLPEIDESGTDNSTGAQLADHIGTQKTSGRADNPDSPPRR